jgi:hypothetical protein
MMPQQLFFKEKLQLGSKIQSVGNDAKTPKQVVDDAKSL